MRSSTFNQNTNLIVIHSKGGKFLSNNKRDLLRFALCTEPLANIILNCFNVSSSPRKNIKEIAIPQHWAGQTTNGKPGIIYYNDNIPLSSGITNRLVANQWFTISNGRYFTQVDHRWIRKVLTHLQADVIAVNLLSQLQAGYEKVLFNSQKKLIGFRRFYNDLIQPAPIPVDWPHQLFIKTDILSKFLTDNALPSSFSDFVKNSFSCSLRVRSINAKGNVLDLGTEEGLLDLLAMKLNSSAKNYHYLDNKYQKEILDKDSVEISIGARFFGKILFGRNVSVGPDAIIVGPTIIGDGVKIAKGAVIKASIINSNVSVSQNSTIQNRVLINGQKSLKETTRAKTNCSALITNSITIQKRFCTNNFRTWPRYSYARCAKRIADIVTAVVMLILFAPVIPIIAIVIKLTSRGPVFFKETRQGLHGKAFNCLKFRTMLVGADYLQDKLRIVNQVDGPQFKMEDDPRISSIGGFLRDTYLDEIPQFFNVLLGQMSVVGPRPSPESENISCPTWRDARLSVRPGITGLWQIRRTRQPMKDFQEWIYYDIKYVRELSLKMDLWICWQTVKKLVKNFVSQF